MLGQRERISNRPPCNVWVRAIHPSGITPDCAKLPVECGISLTEGWVLWSHAICQIRLVSHKQLLAGL